LIESLIPFDAESLYILILKEESILLNLKTSCLLVIILILIGIILSCEQTSQTTSTSNGIEQEQVDVSSSEEQESTVTVQMPSIILSPLERMKYNHPNLTVDLGVGLWAQPLPMDYDNDGDYDLLVVSNDVPSNGLYFFENIEGNIKHPVFKPPVRISHGLDDVTISYNGKEPIIATPGKIYPNFKKTGLSQAEPIPYKGNVHKPEGTVRGKQWSFVDYNGDSVLDLMVGIGDTRGHSSNKHGYVYYLLNIGTNKQPKYKKPVKVKADGIPIDVYGKPSPNFVDFNGDNLPDIITGEFIDKLIFFKNIGTKTKPKFYEARTLKNQNNKTIRMDLQMLTVTAIDWTKDGHVDLIVGQEDGRVALIEHTGKVVYGNPIFKDPYYFKQQAEDVKVGALPTPVSFDWNGDEKQDLIVGDSAGRLSFLENLDGGSSPKWAAPVYLKAGGKVIRIQAGFSGPSLGPAETKWGYTVPAVEDWNGDGLPDIIINNIWGKILWYENKGSLTNPKLAPAKPIEVEWSGRIPNPKWNWWNSKGNELVTQWRTTPFVTDLNKDGLNDLVMLDHHGYLSFFERKKIKDKLILLPGKRIFIGEKGSSKFDRHGNAMEAPKGPIQMNSEIMGGSGRRKFILVDWNGDGKLDLIVNGRPNVKLMLNVGRVTEPFLFRDMGDLAKGELAGHSTSPTVVDWDKNGVPDLLIGAEDGNFYYMKNNYR
jgi:hypothetical protein